ncbi:PREDICTED: protein artemis [Nelumbo nucifera]|uniref:Protein artemis n=1 Tax=Nelumbo nucifera TaxID=4432 RepID=A0A1U8B319_NELNU|nr:PREDICTED: protein artemis [Nelumbo nucifera]
MTIEMPKGLPFSVDTWTPSSKKKRHHFLTHAHKDHSTGITLYSSYPIYCTHLTKTLVLQQFPQLDDSLFVCIEIGQSVVIDDPDGAFSVTAFDANHCPGAVMFLFEGNYGNILHTGDCRLTLECLQNLPEKYIGKKGREPRCRLDYVFLDCTFGKFSLQIPNKHSAIQQVINCIWKHPDAPVVYLACDLLGQEDILVEVSRTFGSKIYVNKVTSAEYFQALMLIAPNILCEDESSRFQLFEGFPKLYERAKAKLIEAQTKSQPEPVIIRPSAQWYACEEETLEPKKQRKQRFKEAERDSFGVWHVCYSMHSSREELEWALQLMHPKRVVSTAPSCRAMELPYVKNNCFGAPVMPNDPLWKILDINTEEGSTSPKASTFSQVPVEGDISFSAVKGQLPDFAESKQLGLKSLPTKPTKQIDLCLNLSPPSTTSSITLFGRARLGLRESDVLFQEEKTVSTKIDPSPIVITEKKQESSLQEAGEFDVLFQEKKTVSTEIDPSPIVITEREQESSLQESGVFELQLEKLEESEVKKEKRFPHSRSGPSNDLSESLRKLYRSMRVPVPQPLPSLVELMDGKKRAKRRIHF